MRRTILAAAAFGLIAVLAALLTTTESAGAAVSNCRTHRVGDNVELSWTDEGGKHLIRRDGRWLATPGTGSSIWLDADAPADATYLIRTRANGVETDVSCTPGDMPVVAAGCQGQVINGYVALQWADDGGKHVIRRDGRWLATPGFDSSIWVDTEAPAGATYLLRTRVSGDEFDVPCVVDGDQGPLPTPTPTPAPTPTPGPPAPGVAERVLHVSIDGLRSDHVTPELMPRLTGLFAEGASTLNARTDYGSTKTLPNHTSQFTGRAVYGDSGHRVSFNNDRGGTVHSNAGEYAASVFDVVHDHGFATAMLVGKSKFDFHNRTWNASNGAPDVTGEDNGRDKIDIYRTDGPPSLVDDAIAIMGGNVRAEFTFFHIRTPDSVGHDYGWLSPEYDDAVGDADDVLGDLLDAIAVHPVLAGTTAIIVTADHGGPDSSLSHDNQRVRNNYTVPFGVWGPGVASGADLYALNADVRREPGTRRLGNAGVQPIRTHEMANLALDLLGLPPVPGSTFNADQSLRVN